MGTRHLTIIKNEEGKEICVLYGQWDGYPTGHGADLAEFLKGRKLVNGFSDRESKDFNGMGCLAAQLIAHFKEGIGTWYVYPSGTRDCWEEYVYTIYPENGPCSTICISARDAYSDDEDDCSLIYDGPVDNWVVPEDC